MRERGVAQKVIITYFNKFELAKLVDFKLNENLDAIAGGDNFEQIVFNLIGWAQRQGKLQELIEALCQERPQVEEFKKIREIWQIQQPIITPEEAERRKQQFNRRRFLQLAGLGGGSLAIAVVGRSFFNTTPKENDNILISHTPPSTPEITSSTPKPISLEKFKFEVVTVNSQGKIINENPNEAKFFKEDLGNGVILEMVSIPGGNFIMGSPLGEKGRDKDESPQHTVNVPAFFMGKFQVTQEQYQQVMAKNPSYFNGDKRPVQKVSWNDAVEFCKKLSKKTGRTYRLPSEAEWEYACRAGTTTPFHFGQTITGELANYNASRTYALEPKKEYRKQTTPVGQFPPNAFGLYDMHGNLWEWCEDTRHKNYNGAPKDGSAWIGNDNRYRIIRGGAWGSNPDYCRSAGRNFGYPNVVGGSFGLRVVCGVAPRT
ncbi:MAG: SUMF1/EgtB/PvdO family nonheme iron enzyme [Cyanobacteria bacterium J06635_10]